MKKKRLLYMVATLIVILPLVLISVSATSYTIVENGLTVADNRNKCTYSDGVITITGSGGRFSGIENTVTITNTGANKANVTFDYVASGYGSFSESTASGTIDVNLAAGASRTMKIKGTSDFMSGGTDGVLKLSNFTYTVLIEGTATITYNELGSITVGGSSFASGSTTGLLTETGTVLAANPVSGAGFVAWVNADNNEVLSQNTSFLLKPYATTMSIRAIFTTPGQTPYFKVGTTLFTDLAEAINVANSGNDKTVVVISNGTLPTSNTFNIPNGVSLLAPYAYSDTTIDGGTNTDGSGALYSTLEYANVDFVTADSNGNNGGTVTGIMEPNTSVTYTLTVPATTTINVKSGGKFVVGGTLVGGSYSTTGICGATAGAHSNIQLEGTVNVEGGGILSACGYILGGGTVNAASSATVYQPHVFMDHKDGHYAYGAKEENDGNGYWPYNRHSLMNIQSKLVLSSGSDMYGYVVMFTQPNSFASAQYNVTTTHIVGSAGETALFQLGSGTTMTTTYDASKTLNVTSNSTNISRGYYTKVGRTTIAFNGDVSLGNIEMTLNVLNSDYNLSTEYSPFPISYNYNIVQESGTFYANNHMSLLPGSTFTVDSGAAMTIASDKNFVIFDGLRDYAQRSESVTLDGDDGTGGTWPVYHYPSSANLTSYGFSSAAELMMNGTLTVSGNLGGTVQTTGTTGKIAMDSGAGTSATAQFGVQKSTVNLLVMTIGGSSGKTSRTLNAQVFMGNDTTPTQLEAGKTYMAASSKTNSISSYTYDVYATHDASTATTETKNDLNATVTGTWKLRQAAKLMNGLNLVGGPYAYLADAAADWQSGYSIQMMDNVSDETVKFSDGTYINLNGYSVSGAVSAEGTVYGFDSTSDGYDAPKGSLELTSGTVAPHATVDNKHYLSIAEGSAYTFHRVAVTVTGVQFLKDATKNEYIIFRGEYKGAPDPVLTGVGFGFDNSSTKAEVDGVTKTFEFGFGTSDTTITSVAPQMMFNSVTVTGTIKNAVDNILTSDTSDVLTFPQVFDNFENLLQAIN